MKRYGFIYKTTNLINGKIYIGQKMYTRNNEIKDPAPSYIGSGRKLKSAISKYGKENFKREILCWCLNQQALDDCEKFFIKYYNSMDEDIGYNLCEGGQLQVPKEMLNLKGEKNPNYGHKWTEEMKRMMSEAVKARDISGERNPNFGKRWSREKREEASKKRKESGMFAGINNPRATRVKCIETGKIYSMIKEVSDETGKSRSTVYDCLRNNRKINGKTYIKLNNNSPS